MDVCYACLSLSELRCVSTPVFMPANLWAEYHMLQSASIVRDVLLLLGEHRMRSILTMLGIAVGVWALSTLLAVGFGARGYIQGQVGQLGSNLLIITPGNPADLTTFYNRRIQESLTIDDVYALRVGIASLRDIAPILQSRGEVSYRERKIASSIVGTTDDYFRVRDIRVAYGRSLNVGDLRAASAVAVIGEDVAKRLFVNRNPLNEMIRHNGVNLQVIGVLESVGDSGIGQGRDTEIIVPLTTMQQRILGVRHVQLIYMRPDMDANKISVKASAELILLARHASLSQRGLPFTVADLGQLASIADNLIYAVTLFLASIAAVSLIVGGIGVMNVMLASVRERISEVGIRRAVGATERDIQFQFLLEAGILSGLGGIVGVVSSVFTILLLNLLLPWQGSIGWVATTLVLFISFAIGTFFGYYPAKKASRLTPMEALRYE